MVLCLITKEERPALMDIYDLVGGDALHLMIRRHNFQRAFKLYKKGIADSKASTCSYQKRF